MDALETGVMIQWEHCFLIMRVWADSIYLIRRRKGKVEDPLVLMLKKKGNDT